VEFLSKKDPYWSSQLCGRFQFKLSHSKIGVEGKSYLPQNGSEDVQLERQFIGFSSFFYLGKKPQLRDKPMLFSLKFRPL